MPCNRTADIDAESITLWPKMFDLARRSLGADAVGAEDDVGSHRHKVGEPESDRRNLICNSLIIYSICTEEMMWASENEKAGK